MRGILEGLRSVDGRAALALLYTAAGLTLLEFFYMPWHVQRRIDGRSELSVEAGATYCVATCVVYLVLPALIVRFGQREKLASIGYDLRGFVRHAWVYLAGYVLMLPLLFAAARRPDFAGLYPFVHEARASWGAFWTWEAFYMLQFLSLEAFFRGYLLMTLERRFGWTAIFVMVVPYCMIHYHKPWLEAYAAIAAGVALGALALRFRSFYGGALLHGLVALTMDLLAVRALGL